MLYRWTMWLIAARVEPTKTGTSEYIVDNYGYKPFDKCEFLRTAFLWPIVCLSLNIIALAATAFVIYNFGIAEIGIVGVGIGALLVIAVIIAFVLVGIIGMVVVNGGIWSINKLSDKVLTLKLGSTPKKVPITLT